MSPKRIKRNQSATSQEPIVDEDIISNLPRNVIDYILGKMPIREAVRTSVLSKKWRFYYLTIPELVFDCQFGKELNYFVIKRCAPIFSQFEFRYQFNEIVTKSLMLNPGRIEKFRVRIPNFNIARVPDVNKWILYLSQKNIKKITLQYSKDIVRHKLPPPFFSCLDLTYVTLNNVVFSPPPEFKGFRNLNRLLLSRVCLAKNFFERFLSSCPVLEMLVLRKCSGISHFSISGSNLKLLRIKAAYKFQSISLEKAPNLTEVYVTLESLEMGLEGNPIFDLVKFVGSLCNVKRLVLDGKFLQLLARTPVPPTLSTSPNSLKILELFGVNFIDFDQISVVVCLLRSAPNLQDLHIQASTIKINQEHVSSFLKLLDCRPLSKLKLVKLTNISGFDPEFEFIQFLLFSSPSLVTMSIVEHPELEAEEAQNIGRKLLEFKPPSAVSVDFSWDSKT